MKKSLVDIISDKKFELKGFKVFGFIPVYLSFIQTRTHIKLCGIRDEIEKLSEGEPKVEDFYDKELQKKFVPLLVEYLVIALINESKFLSIFKRALRKKLSKCGYAHLMNLFLAIQQKNEPAFFFTCWKLMKTKDNTLLREEKQS